MLMPARVEPGVRIGDLNRELLQHGLLFAPGVDAGDHDGALDDLAGAIADDAGEGGGRSALCGEKDSEQQRHHMIRSSARRTHS